MKMTLCRTCIAYKPDPDRQGFGTCNISGCLVSECDRGCMDWRYYNLETVNGQMCLFDDADLRPGPKRKGKTAKDFTDYDGFVEKFKKSKHKKTTDDCYTPAEVYEAVLRFVGEISDIKGRPVVRPFYPGGDYMNYDYPPDCIVVDNPPFSIYAKIVRFYISRGIDFFLFGPHLTLFVRNADCAYILTGVQVTYENGAIVNTSFVTSLVKDLRIWICPELKGSIEEAQKRKRKAPLSINSYPAEVLTPSLSGRMLNRGIELKIRKEDCVSVANLDSLQKRKKSLFGSGFLLSEKAVEELKAAGKSAMWGGEEPAGRGCRVELSERERNLIKALSNKK